MFLHRTKKKRKATYNAFSKELIKDKTKIPGNTKNSVVKHKTLNHKVYLHITKRTRSLRRHVKGQKHFHTKNFLLG